MSTAQSVRPGNLPFEVSSFVGRDSERPTVKQLLSKARVVTLAGFGGVGKTRLALRVATELQDDYADGAWLVRLDRLGDPALLAGAVADALGLLDRTTRPAEDVVRDHLAPRRALLVLDNCEHLIDSTARLVQRLVRECPDLHVLATSRQPLGVTGEVVHSLAALSVPGTDTVPREGLDDYESVRLFVDRAGSALGGFSITDRNAAAVARICRRVDGMPLALELAAVRLRAMSAQEIADRLEENFRLLSVDRFGPSRQRTLWASIEWSYALCTSDERTLWERLAVFAGGCELRAAEGICGAGLDQIPALLQSLVEKSILLRDGVGDSTRFRMPETLRQFAAEKLAGRGELAEITRRHRDWYASAVATAEAQWMSGEQVTWLAYFRRDHANLQVALDYCLREEGQAAVGVRIASSLHHYWWATGHLAEGRYYLSSLRGRTDDSFVDVVVLRAVQVEAWLAAMQVDLDAFVPLVGRFDEISPSVTGQPDMDQVRALRTQLAGVHALCVGDVGSSVERLEDSLHRFEALDDPARQAETLLVLIMCASILSDHERAKQYYEAMQAITQPSGEVWFRAYAKWSLGVSSWRVGDLDDATKLLQEAFALARGTNDPVIRELSLEGLAWVAAKRREWVRAARLLGAAESLTPVAGNTMVPAYAEYHAECVRAIQRAVGKRLFASAVAEGRGLSADSVFALALAKAHDLGLRTE